MIYDTHEVKINHQVNNMQLKLKLRLHKTWMSFKNPKNADFTKLRTIFKIENV